METGVTLAELAEETGESPRTLRFYVMQGLLSGPDSPGPKARYPVDHIERVRWIRARQTEGMSLSRIARDLAALDAGVAPLLPPVLPPEPVSPAVAYLRDAGLLAGAVPSPVQPPSPAAVPSTEAGRATWERSLLADGVELHVRRPLDPATQRRVKLLVQQAREIFRRP